MSRLLKGDLDDTDLRAELPRLLAAVRGAGDQPLDPLFAALASRDPVALAEVVCGPRAAGDARVIRAALPYLAPLETALSARGLYPRLVDLAGDAAPEVLAVAAQRHPAAAWLVPLSRRVEAFAPGCTHLRAAAGHACFAAICHAHADAGNLDALVCVAGETGRAEPAAALTTVNRPAAIHAAAAALAADPQSPIVAHLAGVWGPDPDDLVSQLLPHLRSRAAAEALLRHARHLPRAAARLRAVLPGMV